MAERSIIPRDGGGGTVAEDLSVFGEGTLTFQEFAVREPLPLATIHAAVLEFLRGRDDVVLFGAHAVNAYVPEPRMTQDVDLLALHAVELAEEICKILNKRFRIAVRTRAIREGIGYRIYQLQKPKYRHLVDVHPVDVLPPAQRLAEILTLTPVELIAAKVLAYHGRRGQPKSGTDWRDLALLLLAFPELKKDSKVVRARLEASGADAAALAVWEELATQEIRAEEEDDEFGPAGS
jgi:hypothetical protein